MSKAFFAREHYSRTSHSTHPASVTDNSAAPPVLLPVPLLRQLSCPLSEIGDVEQLLAQLRNAQARGCY